MRLRGAVDTQYDPRMPVPDVVKELATEAGFTVTIGDDTTSLDLEGLPVSVKVFEGGPDKIFAVLACHTLSWDWSGERTDLNDVVSHLTAAFVRAFAHLSTRFVLVPNPAVDIKPEIYARYLIFDQPHESAYALDDKGLGLLRRMLMTLVALRSHLPHPHPDLSPNDYGNCPWKPGEKSACPYLFLDGNDSSRLQITDAIGDRFVVGDAIANRRHDPDWLYFRTGPGNLSVVESAALAHILRVLATEEEERRRVVPGIAGQLVVSGHLRNYISSELLRKIRFIFRRLQGRQRETSFRRIPLENSLICVGDKHSIFVTTQCGRPEFERERVRLQARHEAEAQVLFRTPALVWADRLPNARFESMIRDLLQAEPRVTWIRAAGHTNDRDEGRDMIAEWLIPISDPSETSLAEPPVRVGRVVVQCKAFMKSVGKRDVQDIYDTVRRHHAAGYFLAVSSRPTSGLVAFLDDLRQRREVFVDWWGRPEIQERLARSPGILARYPDMVRLSRPDAP